MKFAIEIPDGFTVMSDFRIPGITRVVVLRNGDTLGCKCTVSRPVARAMASAARNAGMPLVDFVLQTVIDRNGPGVPRKVAELAAKAMAEAVERTAGASVFER